MIKIGRTRINSKMTAPLVGRGSRSNDEEWSSVNIIVEFDRKKLFPDSMSFQWNCYRVLTPSAYAGYLSGNYHARRIVFL